MNIIFLGWHLILYPFYELSKNEDTGFGPSLHAFLISFSFHGMNLWSLSSLIAIVYFESQIGLISSLCFLFVPSILGYPTFYKKLKNHLDNQRTQFHQAISIVIALAYTGLSLYFMIFVGDYVFEKTQPHAT